MERQPGGRARSRRRFAFARPRAKVYILIVEAEPRVVEVRMRPGEYLTVGIGGPLGFVEHVTNQPYCAETAVPRQPYADPDGLGYVSFRCGGIGSEVDVERGRRARWPLFLRRR